MTQLLLFHLCTLPTMLFLQPPYPANNPQAAFPTSTLLALALVVSCSVSLHKMHSRNEIHISHNCLRVMCRVGVIMLHWFSFEIHVLRAGLRSFGQPHTREAQICVIPACQGCISTTAPRVNFGPSSWKKFVTSASSSFLRYVVRIVVLNLLICLPLKPAVPENVERRHTKCSVDSSQLHLITYFHGWHFSARRELSGSLFTTWKRHAKA